MSQRIYTNRDIQEKISLAAIKLSDVDLEKFCQKDDSKTIFDINSPLFVKVPDHYTHSQKMEAVKAVGGINRWIWKFEFKRNGFSYAISTQWYAKNDEYVQRWLHRLK